MKFIGIQGSIHTELVDISELYNSTRLKEYLSNQVAFPNIPELQVI
jgi:hypothetical protein